MNIKKIRTVMREFKVGKLRSSSGQRVRSRKQAIAIALSEARKASGPRRKAFRRMRRMRRY